MIYLVLLVPLILLVGISYRFNQKKLDEPFSKIMIISILEGLFGFSIVMFFFLIGFLNTFLMGVGLFLLLVVAGYVGFTIQKDLDDDLDWQIETIKNGIIVFLRTVFPMFVFLTIFRFHPFIFQILLSLGATLVLNLISLPFQKIFYNFWKKLIKYTQSTYVIKYVWLWAIFIVLGVSSFFISLPKDQVSRFFNLSDHAPYVHFDRFPVNLTNEYKAIDHLNIRIPNPLDAQIIDYYYLDNQLYLYTTNDKLYIYDIDEQVLEEHILSNDFIQKSALRQSLVNLFFQSEDSLYLLSQSGIYLVSANDYVKISAFAQADTQWFMMDNQVHLISKQNANDYEIFTLNEAQLISNQSIQLSETPYIGIEVIDNILFYQTTTTLERFDHPNESYELFEGVPAYDIENQIMYYARNRDYSDVSALDTTYHQVDNLGNHKTQSFVKQFNMVGIVSKGTYFLTFPDANKIERFEIMSKDFKFIAIHNPINHTPFWTNHSWTKTYLGNIKNQNGALEYLQVEQNEQTLLLTLRVLEKQTVALPLPFYSHYSLWVFIPLILGIIVPITNYRQYVTFISFDFMTRKKNRDQTN